MGTRRQFVTVIENCALSCNAHYVTQRWLGGMLTNWSTMKTCIDSLQNLCASFFCVLMKFLVLLGFALLFF